VGSGGPGISEGMSRKYIYFGRKRRNRLPPRVVQYADGVGWGKGTEDKSRVRDVSGGCMRKIQRESMP